MIKRVPKQCQYTCPLAVREDLHEYPIVFSLNCSGPEAGDGRGIKERILLSQDGETSIEPGVGNSIGRLVCVNVGANLSLDAHSKPGSV